MKINTFPKSVWLTLLIVLLGLLPACAALQPAVPKPPPTGDQPAASGPSAPAATATPAAAHKSYMAPVLSAAHPVPAEWPSFESPELGVQFRFPPLPGEVKYEFNDWPEREGDPTGTLVEWIVSREGGGYTFAAIESENMQVSRGLRFVDITHWSYDAATQEYSVTLAGPNHSQYVVEPLLNITRSDGLQGIAFRPPSPWKDKPGTDGIYALLDLPIENWPKIKVISFYFSDPVSLDDVEAVLNSVSIKR
jgi:hypothetical protein